MLSKDGDVDSDQAYAKSEHMGDSENGYAADDGRNGNHIALDNAENPLQLLALASAIPNPCPGHDASTSATTSSQTLQQSYAKQNSDVESFFRPLHSNLDNDVDMDPIEVGLVSVEEATTLFS